MRYQAFTPELPEAAVLALGTYQFGSAYIPPENAFAQLDAYRAIGGNLIDTARAYSGRNIGQSEAVVGEWLKKRGCRHELILATKCAHPPKEDFSISRLDRASIRSDVHESLAALGTDYLDLLWLHRDSPDADVGEVMEALNELKKEGKIRALAASNWTTARMEEANRYAAEHQLTGFCGGQIRWSLARIRPEAKNDPTLVDMDGESLQWYARHHLAAFAFTPQAKGFFAKLAKGGVEALPDKTRERYLSEENLALFERVRLLSDQLTVPVSALSIAYLTSRTDFPGFAVTGFSRMEQLTETMQAADLLLTDSQLAFLDGK